MFVDCAALCVCVCVCVCVCAVCVELQSHLLAVLRVWCVCLVLQDYNFRHYAVRRIRAGFRENKALAGAEAEAALTDASGPQLEQLRRMTLVNGLFGSEKSVMENIDHHY